MPNESMRYAVYDIKTGAIICTCYGSKETADLQCEEGCMWFELSDTQKVSDETHYIKSGELKEKSPINYMLEYYLSGAKISGVPENCNARIEGNKFKTDGGDIVLNFDKQGTYSLSVESVEYINTSIRINIDG